MVPKEAHMGPQLTTAQNTTPPKNGFLKSGWPVVGVQNSKVCFPAIKIFGDRGCGWVGDGDRFPGVGWKIAPKYALKKRMVNIFSKNAHVGGAHLRHVGGVTIPRVGGVRLRHVGAVRLRHVGGAHWSAYPTCMWRVYAPCGCAKSAWFTSLPTCLGYIASLIPTASLA